MRNSPDPTLHQQLERQMMEHVERLLADDRLRVDTLRGRRPVTTLYRTLEHGDHAVELKRLMAEMGRPDRELQARMPVGTWMEITLSQRRLFFFKQEVGRIQVVCLSPLRALIAEQAPEPLSLSEVQKVLTELSMANRGSLAPSTVVLVSTSGFEPEAGDLAERRADRTLILVQPNDAGGWKVTGPVETKALVDLFDPEVEEQKRLRIRKHIQENEAEMLSGGIAGDRVAVKLELPLQLVEAELKSFARDKPGLQAKRLDGRIVLFREGVTGASPEPSGEPMGIFDRVKALFGKKGDDTQKIAHLSERRAALLQQQERLFMQLGSMESREADLKEQFKASNSALTKRRITSQLVMLHKDLDRMHQMLAVIGQQVNIVATHLHNLELVRQGQGARLPASEELTADAVKAEEILAQLQADTETATAVGASSGASMSEEEQALFEQLEREAEDEKKTSEPVHTEPEPPVAQRQPPVTIEPEPIEPEEPPPVPSRNNQRSQAEPG